MKSVKKLLLFILGIVIIPTLALGIKWNHGDSATKVLELKQNQSQVFTVDLSKEFWLKRLLQPNSYSLRFRFKVDGKPELYCKPEPGDLEFFVSPGNKKGVWPKLDEDKPLVNNNVGLRSGEGGKGKQPRIPVSVELKVPNNAPKGTLEGRLIFLEKGKEYSRMTIKVLNAK